MVNIDNYDVPKVIIDFKEYNDLLSLKKEKEDSEKLLKMYELILRDWSGVKSPDPRISEMSRSEIVGLLEGSKVEIISSVVAFPVSTRGRTVKLEFASARLKFI